MLLAAGSGALALAALLVFQRGGAAPRPSGAARPTQAATQPSAATVPVEAAPAAAARPVVDVVAIAGSADAGDFPPPTPDQVLPRPERNELAAAERGEQALASLDLIARSIDRLEKERQEAARSGDDATARLNQIRIERLHRRREALEQGLEAAQDAP